MILSVSRRTDIPAFYSEWFINRLKEKCVWVRNPMNYHSISEIDLSPNVVDCIVFWTKNPQPMFKYLDTIDKNYKFYFQYTINAYDKEVEPNLPLLNKRIENFIYLSNKYGKDKVIWRYDPIILTNKYNMKWHEDKFKYIAQKLQGFVSSCVFSFIDVYDKNRNNLSQLELKDINLNTIRDISQKLKTIADEFGIEIKTCSEDIDLINLGIKKSCCIDPILISNIINCKIKTKKDKNQRASCGCVESIDIGQYNTCKHGCIYCYANYSQESVKTNCLKHVPTSKLLLGQKEDGDKINKRVARSLKDLQTTFFD